MAHIALPTLITPDATLNTAFRIALGDLVTSIAPRQAGLLDAPAPVLDAGLDYPTPWIRDSAINIWNGASLLVADVMRNNLLSLVDGAQRINPGGQYDQYWDVIIWSLGAWWHYLFTGDEDLLRLALAVTHNTLRHCEATEFDAAKNLFRGPAVYGDGVAGYPDRYLNNGGGSGILEWRHHNPDDLAPAGYGLPMFALSTNCLYYEVYRLVAHMARILGQPAGDAPAQADRLKDAINRHFWNPATGTYRYLLDPFGGCDHQEGMGHSFALLFGVADDAQARQILANQHIAAAGIPCVYPTFARYAALGGYGRHSGTVWSHIQGLWGHAAAQYGQPDLFQHELHTLAARAVRDEQFAENFHPDSGAIYGGLQEGDPEPLAVPWKSCSRQTWSASALVRLVLMGLAGMDFAPDGIRFAPVAAPDLWPIEIGGLRYREMTLTVRIEAGERDMLRLNDRELADAVLPASLTGQQVVTLYRQ